MALKQELLEERDKAKGRQIKKKIRKIKLKGLMRSNSFLAVAAFSGEMATLGYQYISQCAIPKLWVETKAIAERQSDGQFKTMKSKYLKKMELCDMTKSHFGKIYCDFCLCFYTNPCCGGHDFNIYSTGHFFRL